MEKRKLFIAVIVILLVIIGVESTLLFTQMQVNQKIQAESEKYVKLFEKGGLSGASKTGTDVLLKNIQFVWSPHVFIRTPELTATIMPLEVKTAVNFDRLTTFIARVHQGEVYIRPDVLGGMFNESIFNYPDSKLRDLKVSISQQGNENLVELTGSLNFIFWIPFQMTTDLSIDHPTNTLVISVHSLKVFGFLPITKLLDFQPFHLEKLLSVPANKHLLVHGNQIMVKPFGLFPPPKIDGKMNQILVTPNFVRLNFNDGEMPRFDAIPIANAPSYIYLQGGTTRFGLMGMADTHLQVIDKTHSSLFRFSLLNYLGKLPQSHIRIDENYAVNVEMPPEPAR